MNNSLELPRGSVCVADMTERALVTGRIKRNLSKTGKYC